MPNIILGLLVLTGVIFDIIWLNLIVHANLICFIKGKLEDCLLELTHLLLAIIVHVMIFQYLRLINRIGIINQHE